MENMKFKTTHYYIFPVHTDDGHAYEPTHCSIEMHPLILWTIFRYMLTAWIIQAINKEIQEVRFRFIETGWLNVRDADAEVAEGATTEEGLTAFDDMTPHMEGEQLEALGFGCFRLHCYEKYGASFYSEEIRFVDLLKWEYFSWT
jgi:hypothetical protein